MLAVTETLTQRLSIMGDNEYNEWCGDATDEALHVVPDSMLPDMDLERRRWLRIIDMYRVTRSSPTLAPSCTGSARN